MTGHNERRISSPSASISTIEHSKLLPWLMLSTLLAGIAIAMSLMVFYAQATAYRELEREVRLQRLETDELGAALARAGISIHREVDKP